MTYVLYLLKEVISNVSFNYYLLYVEYLQLEGPTIFQMFIATVLYSI